MIDTRYWRGFKGEKMVWDLEDYGYISDRGLLELHHWVHMHANIRLREGARHLHRASKHSPPSSP